MFKGTLDLFFFQFIRSVQFWGALSYYHMDRCVLLSVASLIGSYYSEANAAFSNLHPSTEFSTMPFLSFKKLIIARTDSEKSTEPGWRHHRLCAHLQPACLRSPFPQEPYYPGSSLSSTTPLFHSPQIMILTLNGAAFFRRGLLTTQKACMMNPRLHPRRRRLRPSPRCGIRTACANRTPYQSGGPRRRMC